nr:hypothetical protein [uncultured Desulfobacter sp.]
MRFIIFCHRATLTLGSCFSQSIIQQWPGVEIELFQTVRTLQLRLRQVPGTVKDEIHIFLADSKRRLLELIQLNGLVEDKKLVLVVPEQSEEMMRLAVQLSPRYIAGIRDGDEALNRVLKKMTRNSYEL